MSQIQHKVSDASPRSGSSVQL